MPTACLFHTPNRPNQYSDHVESPTKKGVTRTCTESYNSNLVPQTTCRKIQFSAPSLPSKHKRLMFKGRGNRYEVSRVRAPQKSVRRPSACFALMEHATRDFRLNEQGIKMGLHLSKKAPRDRTMLDGAGLLLYIHLLLLLQLL